MHTLPRLAIDFVHGLHGVPALVVNGWGGWTPSTTEGGGGDDEEGADDERPTGGQPMLGARLAKPVRGTSGTTGASEGSEDGTGDETGVGHSTCWEIAW